MIDREFDAIEEADIQRLITNGVPEGRALEYKQVLPGGSDAERREYLADASSLANASGGDLVYGIKERRDENGKATGVPESADGLAVTNRDAEVQRLEAMLRDGIAPRLVGVRYRWIDGFPSGPILLMRVARSWSGPHMVTFQQISRFYSRSASGKYLLDVFQLRDAFLQAASAPELARVFRSERLARITAAETPVPLKRRSLIVVHAIPHASIAGRLPVDIRAATNHTDLLVPFYADFASGFFNIDGYATSSPSTREPSSGYLQIFRNGVIETVDSAMVASRGEYGVTLPSVTIADRLFRFLSRTNALYQKLDVPPPYSIFMSFHGAAGCLLGLSERLTFFQGINARPFDRDDLIFPELAVEDFRGEIQSIARPLLDALWQAAGLSRCLQYDEHGTWQRDR